MNHLKKIGLVVETSLELKRRFFAESSAEIVRASQLIAHSIQNDGKLLVYGNGGSAADAQHMAAELLHRLDSTRPERPGIPALALTTDSSTLTAIGNDVSFDSIFSRQIAALGRPGDVALGISTTGNSPNVVEATRKAKDLSLTTVVLVGGTGGRLRELADCALVVPHLNTPRVQEVHLMIEHLLCELIEDELFGREG